MKTFRRAVLLVGVIGAVLAFPASAFAADPHHGHHQHLQGHEAAKGITSGGVIPKGNSAN